MKPFYSLAPFLFLFSITFLHTVNGQSFAVYNFTITSTWNETDHTSIPNNAHWSDLVGATHNVINEFLEEGQPASIGIKNVAELGSNTNFENEVNVAIASNRANQWLQEPFTPHAAISSATLTNVQVNENYPLLTLVSMVAPSPDWFIMINSLNLRNETNTNWKPSFSTDVYAFDAGTDDGIDYESNNMASNPPVGIFKINGPPFNGNVIGTLTVSLQSVLDVKEDTFQNLSIYPNPSDGKVTISHSQNITFKDIEVFNVIGKLIKTYNHIKPANIIKLDLSQLNKGIYILRLNTINGRSKTLKLALQ
ncbi:T9SS type A sorting domain-containing protein [Aestuariivivens marinum]|uniref:T9SS type A sorting domain-containing protein n=1 Tax=Aestuariivivens marinum TaxID=2913555 RepID=UPI001F576142|nr:spondin domain-containing protein [Aestuariivivens marinum]